jgi:nucleotide-binding universal stress UspA family protein
MPPSLMVGPNHTAPLIVAALDGSVPNRCTTTLAAGLIKRMGWRLALVPVPLTATAADRRRRLVAAALDERAALIASPATDHGSAGGKAAACLALATRAPCPVLAVPLALGTEPALNGPVVCGIDGADSSAPIACAAARLAVALGAGLELVHVGAPRESGAAPLVALASPFGGRMWRALHSLEVLPPVEVVVESGDPAGRLCALAESKGAVLVIGAPANGATVGEGRLAAAILTESRVPIAVVSGGDRTMPAVARVGPKAVAA